MITVVTAFAVAVSTAGAQSPEAIIDRAVNNYSSMKSMRVEFRQTITNPLTGTTSVSSGELLRRQPNLLAINFSNPKGDRIVDDGRAVWVYLPSTAPGQVVRLTKGSKAATTVDPQSLFLSSPRSRFNISGAGTEVVGGVNTNVIVLTPKTSSAPFTRAKVWVTAATGSVKQFEVTDANGLTRFVTITRIVANPAIARSAFSFTPPPRTRILDSASLGGT
jgi:outer membrane lipoprotein carrier protein